MALTLAVAGRALAQEEPANEYPDILPPAPLANSPESSPMLTTKDQPSGTLPWKAGSKQQDDDGKVVPFSPSSILTTKDQPKKPVAIPFGKPSSDVSQPLPSGPRMLQAVPVPGVDAVEVTEPAAPSTAPLEADPVAENPETPTEQTAPIFSDNGAIPPIAIEFRVLNKVTGRSERIEAKPEEVIHFGKLEIEAITCQTSIPQSQRDVAGLFALSEFVPGTDTKKPLFRGWMYASSPSITSLEHPVYDVTMVNCRTKESVEVADKKTATPAAKKKDTSAPVAASTEDAIAED